VPEAEPGSIVRTFDHQLLTRVRDNLEGRAVAVTGGASFIGSHLTEALIDVGADVRVIDDLSTGDLGNLAAVMSRVDFRHADLTDRVAARDALVDREVVYHLAAVHGGRSFLESHPVECLGNVALDNLTMEAASSAGVANFVYASSASVYPVDEGLVQSTDGLPEAAAGLLGPSVQNPDGPYGWSKLMGEYQLSVFSENRRMNGVVCRIFNTYGERSGSGHAVRSLVTRALAHIDPFPVWGDGSQTRGFTYVGDVVTGLLLCGGRTEFTVLNLGCPDTTTITDLVRETFRQIDWTPREVAYQLDQPQGTSGRVADPRRCFELLGWQPSTPLSEGLEQTIAWCRRQDISVNPRG
jgi:nucleoside-diphosphate-sugar epimerase